MTDMIERPVRLARVAGVFYLLVIVIAMPGILMMGRLIDRHDAAATAERLLANQAIVYLAFAGYLLSTAAYVVVTALFYLLFRVVDRPVSLVAAFFSVVGLAAGAMSMLFVAAPLLVLRGIHPAALGTAASQDLAVLMNQLYLTSFDIGMVFFGFYCILIGWLIYHSRFLPRVLGVLMMIGGAGYLAFLWPPLALKLFPLHVVPGFIGEFALTLWLLFRGVDGPRWLERAQAR